MKTALSILFFILTPLLAAVADERGADSLGLAQEDARKLGDIGSDSELWVVALARASELSSSDFPVRISFVYLTSKSASTRIGPFRAGTEIK